MKLTFIYLFIPLTLLLPSCQKSNKEISNVQEIDCSFDESMTIKLSEITDCSFGNKGRVFYRYGQSNQNL